MSKIDWAKLQEFQNEHKDLLVMFASPQDDGVSISFGGLNTFVKFPMESMDHGIVFNMLRESKFREAIDPFILGVAESMGISTYDKSANEMLKLIGGSVKAIGAAKSKQGRENLLTKQPKKWQKKKK